MDTIRKITGITRPYWPRVFLGIIFGVIVSAFTGAIAWIVKHVVDIVIVEKRYEYFELIAVGILILFTIRGFVQYGYAYLMKSSANKLIRDTQNRLHNHILKIPVSYFHKEASGMILSRVINDVRILGQIFTEVFRGALIQIPTIIVLLGVAFYRKWDITLMTLALFPFIAITSKRLGRRVKKRTLNAQKKLSFLTQRLNESITGAKIIKVFNREEHRDEKFITDNHRVYRENMKVVRLKETTKLIIDVITGIGVGLVVWYAGRQVQSGIVTSGEFMSAIAAIYMVFVPIKKLGESYNYLQEVKAALERIDGILLLDREEEVSDRVRIKGFENEIRFDNVSFYYGTEEELVLKDINLEIRAGELLALVGPSGAGKTTMSDLIPRFYDPKKGGIKIDGVDIRDYDLKSLRELIGIVSQDIILFNDSIKENIALGDLNAGIDDIKKAAELAYASEFIEKISDGYDAIIGERGLTLSGGQRQRLAIARAILKNPPILILDEATSSLDTVSESLVQNAIEGLMKNRTTIVIAHRLTTIKNADRIVVLESGQITDIGTHDGLLAKSEMYSKLCSEMVSS